ncbi:MAG: glycosyltransferase family 2 protein [Planctomycetota bacterium]
MPLFSVVIPSFNRGAYIVDTIDSVMGQREQDREIIVVDDGSTDDTLAILARYGDRIRVVTQANAGPGAARTLGMREARGEYVAFLDSDDLWPPWTLAVQRAAIERHGRPAVLASRQRDIRQTTDLGELVEEPLHTTRFDDFFASPRGWWLPSGMALRREVGLAVGGFTTAIRICEDADFWLRLGTAPGFVTIDRPLCIGYRVHGGNISASWPGQILGVETLMATERAGGYPGGSARQRQRRDYICRHARPISLGAARDGHTRIARKLYRETFAWNLALYRVRYLAAFPLVAAATRQRPSTPPQST